MLTAFPVDAEPCAAVGAVVVAPRLLPVVPWLRAFEVLEVGPPPVRLMVLPFERVLPVDPVELPVAVPALDAPAEPPPVCASAKGEWISKMPIIKGMIFICLILGCSTVTLRQSAPIGFVPADPPTRNNFGISTVEKNT